MKKKSFIAKLIVWFSSLLPFESVRAMVVEKYGIPPVEPAYGMPQPTLTTLLRPVAVIVVPVIFIIGLFIYYGGKDNKKK